MPGETTRSSLSEGSIAIIVVAKFAKVLFTTAIRPVAEDVLNIPLVLFALLSSAAAVLLITQKPWRWVGLRRVKSNMWGGILVYSLIHNVQLCLWLIGLACLHSSTVFMLTEYGQIWWVAIIRSLAMLISGSTLDGAGIGKSDDTSGKTLGSRGGQLALLALGITYVVDCVFLPSEDLNNDTIFSITIGFMALAFSNITSAYHCTLDKKYGLSETLGGTGPFNVLAFSIPLSALLISPLAFAQWIIFSIADDNLWGFESPPATLAIFSNTTINISTFFVLAGISILLLDALVVQQVASDVLQRRSGLGDSIGRSLVLVGWATAVVVAWLLGIGGIGGVTLGLGGAVFGLVAAGVWMFTIQTLLLGQPILGQTLITDHQTSFSYSSSSDLPTHQHRYKKRGSNDRLATSRSNGSMQMRVRLLRGYLQVILANQDSRQIFYFLCLNLTYMFVQAAYGIWTNSLGLISDAIHMFFDCLALGVGLFASVMSTWGANQVYSYGYNRIEVLSGFANGVFLVLISIFIMLEAIERLVHPFEMNTDRLMLVSFLGFVVNMVGIFAFNHGHAHGGGGGGCGHDHGPNANMQAVFLHILADTLGSVGVILSTFLIDQFGWTGFDPIASMVIALLIFASVVPLIQSSARVLMNRPGANIERMVNLATEKLLLLPGVLTCSRARIWPIDHEKHILSLHIRAQQSVLNCKSFSTNQQSLHAHDHHHNHDHHQEHAHNCGNEHESILDDAGLIRRAKEILFECIGKGNLSEICIEIEREQPQIYQ